MTASDCLRLAADGVTLLLAVLLFAVGVRVAEWCVQMRKEQKR